jgi:6,7-dimethyl-8-ribityllumazine synthase
MPQETLGSLDGREHRIAVVVARFNEFITSKLQAGALDCLRRHGVEDRNLHVVHVPGSFEIPLAARTLAASGQYDAVVCVGAVIRGATPHFDLVAHAVARGVAEAGNASGIPVTFGVVTTDTLEQAIDRAGGKAGNKGWDAAATAIEMVNLLRALRAR